jgi:hypothetical protein
MRTLQLAARCVGNMSRSNRRRLFLRGHQGYSHVVFERYLDPGLLGKGVACVAYTRVISGEAQGPGRHNLPEPILLYHYKP